MSTTSDPQDPSLCHGSDDTPAPQNETYLVLSDEERAKGFVRPVRKAYVHVGPAGPANPLRDLTPEEHQRYDAFGYVKFEPYGDGSAVTGRYWTQAQLDATQRRACGAVTYMASSIAETYARDPHFYGSTYCVGCGMHRPVGAAGEFVWDGTTERVGS